MSLTVARSERAQNVLTHASLIGILINSVSETVSNFTNIKSNSLLKKQLHYFCLTKNAYYFFSFLIKTIKIYCACRQLIN